MGREMSDSKWTCPCGQRNSSSMDDMCQGCGKMRQWTDEDYFVFVDGMDGDGYRGAVSAGGAVTHALLNGAKKVEVKRVKK